MKEHEIKKFYDDLARRLTDARKEHVPPFTQEDLAERTDSLSRSAIANIESFRQRVALHQLLEIVAALSLDLDDVLPEIDRDAGEDTVISDDPAARSFISALRESGHS